MIDRLLWIVWPAFLGACILELIVFGVIDPSDVHWGGDAVEWSRQTVYTAAFFAFWVVTMGACALTMLLRLTAAELNRLPQSTGHPGPGQGGVAS